MLFLVWGLPPLHRGGVGREGQGGNVPGAPRTSVLESSLDASSCFSLLTHLRSCSCWCGLLCEEALLQERRKRSSQWFSGKEGKKRLVIQSCPALLQPHGLLPARLLHPWNSPGKNTGVGCHSLLQGILPTQGSNLGLLQWQADSYCLSHPAVKNPPADTGDLGSIPGSGRFHMLQGN